MTLFHDWIKNFVVNVTAYVQRVKRFANYEIEVVFLPEIVAEATSKSSISVRYAFWRHQLSVGGVP